METPWVRKKTPDHDRVRELLELSEERNHYTNGGPVTRLLEQKAHVLLELPAGKRVVAVNNGAMGLNALAAAVDVHRGERVKKYATQAFTFPCSAQMEFDGRTEIVDVTEEGELDLSQVPVDCDGLVVTNVFGTVGDVGKFLAWQREREGRVLFFDNAAAPFTFTADGVNTCALGTGSIVSLHHTKPIGFGEGGLVIIDAELEPVLRRVINFGYDPVTPLPWMPRAGNGKMSDVAAAYIVDAFERRGEEIKAGYARRLDGLRAFRDSLHGRAGWSLLLDDLTRTHGHRVSPSALCVVFKEEGDAVRFRAHCTGVLSVEARQYYRPLTKQKNANSIFSRIACIPCHVSDDVFLKIAKELARFKE